MKSKEAHLVSEDPPPTNNGIQEGIPARQDEMPARQDVDVLLDVQELEVDRIGLTARGLGAHVSVLAEVANLVNLQVGVDARLDEAELEIEGVKAKVLLKARLDNVRAILEHTLDTVAQHPEILRILTRAQADVSRGTLGNALSALENVLKGLELGDTVDELLKGRLEEVRDTLQEVLNQVGEQSQEVGGTLVKFCPGAPLSPPQQTSPQEPHRKRSKEGLIMDKSYCPKCGNVSLIRTEPIIC